MATWSAHLTLALNSVNGCWWHKADGVDGSRPRHL